MPDFDEDFIFKGKPYTAFPKIENGKCLRIFQVPPSTKWKRDSLAAALRRYYKRTHNQIVRIDFWPEYYFISIRQK